jgi:predicted ATPase
MHRLKDLGEPLRLYQLGDAEFPPPRSLNPTNLPAQLAPLIGRRRELEDVVQLVRSGARLVTLSGPGGVGKTRLALQAAAELADEFVDGVVWVPLAALRDPALVLPRIAQTVGATYALAEYIGEKAVLVLLDNFEPVLAAAPALSDVLAKCPNLHVCATSRALLRITGEREYSVPGLPSVDAVCLFRERAEAGEPEAAVVEICRRLDGLPLAIELAAQDSRASADEAARASGTALAAPHRRRQGRSRTSTHPSGDDRLELRAALPGRAASVRLPRGLRRRL